MKPRSLHVCCILLLLSIGLLSNLTGPASAQIPGSVLGAPAEPQFPALHLAAELRDRPETLRLVKAGADPTDAANVARWTPLHFSAHNGGVDVAGILLGHGAEPNAQDGRNWTPLHLAATRGDLRMVQLLLERGASPDIQNDAGETALHFAVASRNFKMVADLLEYNASPNIGNRENETPMVLALKQNDPVLIRLLRVHGGAAEDVATYNPDRRIHTLVNQGDAAELVDAEGDLLAVNSMGLAPLHLAVIRDSLEMVQILIEQRGVTINHRDASGFLPLHYACELESPEIAKYLLAHGADVNDQENLPRWTPLHFANLWQRENIAKRLIESGADPTAQDAQGRAAKHLPTSLATKLATH